MAITVVLGVAAYIGSELETMVANYLAVGAMLSLTVTVVAAMHEIDDGLKIESFKNGSLTLRGVSRGFARAVESRAKDTNR